MKRKDNIASMKKWRVAFLFLLILLVACQNEQEPPQAPFLATTSSQTVDSPISLTLAVNVTDVADYRRIVRQFMEEYPNISVRVAEYGELGATGSDDPNELARLADVFTYYPYFGGEATNLLDLQPFMQSTEERQDFYPGLLPPADEPLFGLPVSVKYPIIFYAKSAFAARDMPYPHNEWELSDFLEAATALTSWQDGDIVQWGYVPDQLRYSPLLSTQLERPFYNESNSRLNDEDVLAALQWTHDLFTVYRVAPWLNYYKPAGWTDDNGSDLNPYVLIESGLAAMWQQPHTNFVDDADVGVVAIPHAEGHYSADPIQKGFAISQGSQNREAAWELLLYLSKQPPIEILGNWHVPARRSVAEASGFWQDLPLPLADALHYAVSNTVTTRLNREGANLLLESLVIAIDTDQPLAASIAHQSDATPQPNVTNEPFVVATPAFQPVAEAEHSIIFMSGFNRLSQEALAEEFMRANPDIFIEFVERNIGANQKPLPEQIALTQTDCFVSGGDNIPTTALAPLASFYELDSKLSPDDFYPVIFDAFRQEGEIYAVPGTLNVPYLLYNRTLLRQMGIPEPDLTWTADDFLDMMLQVAAQDEGIYGYAEYFPVLSSFSRGMLGISLIDENSAEFAEYNLDGVEIAIRWSVDLIHLYEVQLQTPQFGGEDTLREIARLINQNKLLFWPSFLTDPLEFTNIPIEVEIGAAIWPSSKGMATFDIIGRSTAYYIAAESDQKQACWEWISFLAQQPTQAAPTDWMPAYIAASQSPAYVGMVGPATAELFQTIATGENNFSIGATGEEIPDWFAAINYWSNKAYEDAAVAGNVNSAIALLRERYSEYRDCVYLENGFDEYTIWRECAVTVDPTLSTVYERPSE